MSVVPEDFVSLGVHAGLEDLALLGVVQVDGEGRADNGRAQGHISGNSSPMLHGLGCLVFADQQVELELVVRAPWLRIDVAQAEGAAPQKQRSNSEYSGSHLFLS
jgi:hypothetical protein